MKFKLDENLSPSLATLFSDITNDVHSVTEQSLNGAPDERVIDACTREGRASSRWIWISRTFARVRRHNTPA